MPHVSQVLHHYCAALNGVIFNVDGTFTIHTLKGEAASQCLVAFFADTGLTPSPLLASDLVEVAMDGDATVYCVQGETKPLGYIVRRGDGHGTTIRFHSLTL